MNKGKFKEALSIANKGESILNAGCGLLEEMFQLYFDVEISVEYQPSDGFVIVHEVDGFPLNEPVKTAFEAIDNDKDAYR